MATIKSLQDPTVRSLIEQTARVLTDPAIRRAQEIGEEVKRAADAQPKMSSYTAALETATAGVRVLDRMWSTGLGQLVSSLPLNDVNKLAELTTRQPEATWLSDRGELLDLYDDLYGQDFDSPLLAHDAIKAARALIASAPEAAPAPDANTGLSPEVQAEIDRRFAELTEQLEGQGPDEAASPTTRRRWVARIVVTLMLTAMIVAQMDVPEALADTLEIADCLVFAAAAYAYLIKTPEQRANDRA